MNYPIHSLAFDMGSSSGRATLGVYDGDKLVMEEVHSFERHPVRIGSHWYWDIFKDLEEIRTGLIKTSRLLEGKPFSVGIDTWGVDYGLIDSHGELMAPVYSYRDPRTEGLFDSMFEKMPKEELYSRTGIMFIQFNTLLQLFADYKRKPYLLDNCEKLLFPPDLFVYFLTGKALNELTIASTSQFIDPSSKDWAPDVLSRCGLPDHMLCPLVRAGSKIGNLSDSFRASSGLPDNITVVAVGGHDTASAVAATPFDRDGANAFISLGTWSLLGMELDSPHLGEASLNNNYTNELGVGDKVVYHKILCGLWLVQECRRKWKMNGEALSYEELHEAAKSADPFKYTFDPEDPRFMSPDDMPKAITSWFEERGLESPTSKGEMIRSIYESLALSYRDTLKGIEETVGEEVEAINVVGGGTKASLLCQFTASATGKRVITGPVEATTLGNLLSQLQASGAIHNLEEGRNVVRRSCDLKEYFPENHDMWKNISLG